MGKKFSTKPTIITAGGIVILEDVTRLSRQQIRCLTYMQGESRCVGLVLTLPPLQSQMMLRKQKGRSWLAWEGRISPGLWRVAAVEGKIRVFCAL